jgi:hypothetical protein
MIDFCINGRGSKYPGRGNYRVLKIPQQMRERERIVRKRSEKPWEGNCGALFWKRGMDNVLSYYRDYRGSPVRKRVPCMTQAVKN